MQYSTGTPILTNMKIEDSNVVRDTLVPERRMAVGATTATAPPHVRSDDERDQNAFDSWRDVLNRRSSGHGGADHAQIHGVDVENSDPRMMRLINDLSEDIAHLIRALEGAERRIALLAEDNATDPVSRLPSRASVMRETGHLIALDRQEQGHSTVGLLRLDQVETIRQIDGRQGVDRLNQHVGTILTNALQTGERAGIVGDGEYAVLLTGLSGEGAANRAQILAGAIVNAPNVPNNTPLDLSVSVGLTEIRPDDTAEKALERADLDMRTPA